MMSQPGDMWQARARHHGREAPDVLRARGVCRRRRLAPLRLVNLERRNALVEEHLGLVGQQVDRLSVRLPPHVDRDDLWQAGALALVHAAGRCKEGAEATFAGFAALRIRGALLDELRGQDRMGRSGRRVSKLVRAASEQLEQELGRAPTDEEVCARSGLDAGALKRLRVAEEAAKETSLDITTPDGVDMHERLVDEQAETPGRAGDEREQMRVLLERMGALPPRLSSVLRKYWLEDKRLQDIADEFGVTESRVSQLLAEATKKLRRAIGCGYA